MVDIYLSRGQVHSITHYTHYSKDLICITFVQTISVSGALISDEIYVFLLSGFLNIDDSKAPGNYALYDQVAALQWLKENIEPFGGDPNEVTLLGHGYGGAMVNLLMVSPVTKGKPNVHAANTKFNQLALQGWNNHGAIIRPWEQQTSGTQEFLTFSRQEKSPILYTENFSVCHGTRAPVLPFNAARRSPWHVLPKTPLQGNRRL